jgi:hypothetical protein
MTTERDRRESAIRQAKAAMERSVERGCTEAEAMTALAKFHALKDTYEITEDELNLTKEEKAILRREPPASKDPHRIKRLLSTAVARFCGCQGWREGQTIAFCGLRSDAEFATWLLDNLPVII